MNKVAKENIGGLYNILKDLEEHGEISFNSEDTEEEIALIAQKIIEGAADNGQSVFRWLITCEILSESIIKRLTGSKEKTAYLSSQDIDLDALEIIGEEISVRCRVVPYKLTDSSIIIGYEYDNLPSSALEEMKGLVGSRKIQVLKISKNNVDTCLNTLGDKFHKIISNKEGDDDFIDRGQAFSKWKELIDRSPPEDSANEADVVRSASAIGAAIQSMMHKAFSSSATDIHIYPVLDANKNKKYRCDVRVDGDLEMDTTWRPDIGGGIIGRFREAGDMPDTLINRVDGKYSIYTEEGSQYDLRLAGMPLSDLNGMWLTIRLLPQNKEAELSLEDIYPTDESSTAKDIHDLFKDHAEGIILVAGRTGDGKSTTMASTLREQIHDGIRVATVEQPKEYDIEGAVQIHISPQSADASGVNKRLDFGGAIKGLLRMDPDIIMIGEIRDDETAKVSISAAETGHIVVSTVHAKSASAAMGRMEGLGIPLASIADSLVGVISQRLVKRICKDCFEGNAKECRTCGGTGYSGRAAVAEVLKIDSSIAKMIREGKSHIEIEEESGMKTMADHAAHLVKNGKVSLEEANKIIGRANMGKAMEKTDADI